MRIYLPATSTTLRTLADEGIIGPSPLTAFAVTPGLREWYLDDDLEELEYAASSEAARASLRLLSNDFASLRRRVVIAADVANELVTVRDDLDRGVVRVSCELPIAACVSIHLDDADAEGAVASAAKSVDAADLGDASAEEVVSDADGFELSWYAIQELADLLADLERPPR
jgi:hypothetical protein